MERKINYVDLFKKDIAPIIIKKYKPEKIFLFGSRINGDYSNESDLDVIIISRKFSKIPFIRRMGMILKEIDFPIHLDIFCYTEEEFNQVKNNSIIISSGLKGAVLL